ncbi:zinc-binding alcohol dehydrogenase family protein [Bacillus atrophaeus]|uniref:zinc-binding alcohol dehydrogenase family protein n=1 Tax=Bacillus atrophaeus TaxID=1452 RepID=UPI0028F713CD|nr:zinc-binding alcohol dehydrogenase family protein [Bacillus atrophaeus]WNV80606.1 zinc-binding alcohol dehydrogenase family protein [Bacillus atrophaeus]
MKAVGLHRYLPIDEPDSLIEEEIEKPVPKGRDLLVKIAAVSVNPVDAKIRSPKAGKEDELKILGWDACGTVVQTGENCEWFQEGDEVYYAGDVNRQGSNSEYQLVDERIAAKKPESLSRAEAAAMPLTTLTAWEALFDRLRITKEDEGKTILIIGGAGGVGSIATQLAKQAGLTVAATASREETKDWCFKMGADHVINHHHVLLPQLKAAGINGTEYILCLNDTDGHWEGMADVILPQGTICSIVENQHPLDLNLLKSKSAGFVWEFMFTRAMFQTDDMIKQREILTKAAKKFDQGKLRHTLTTVLKPFSAEQLKKAHAKIESGKMIGKLVVEYS